MLLVTMSAMVMSPSSVKADVITVPDIPVDCAPPDVCATLRFYDADGNLLDWTMGKVLKPVKNVAKVQQVGTGSYTVFKGKNHRSESACLSGNHMIDLKTDAYYEATVVKSVRYEQNGCPPPSMAGVPLWLVGAVIGVVVLVAVLIFVVMLRKRKAALRGEPVPTEA